METIAVPLEKPAKFLVIRMKICHTMVRMIHISFQRHTPPRKAAAGVSRGYDGRKRMDIGREKKDA